MLQIIYVFYFDKPLWHYLKMKKYLTLTNIKYILFMFGVIVFLTESISSSGIQVIHYNSSGIFIDNRFIDGLLAFVPYLFVRIWEAFYK